MRSSVQIFWKLEIYRTKLITDFSLVGIFSGGLSKKVKVTKYIQINRSGLRVSNSKVPSSGYFVKSSFFLHKTNLSKVSDLVFCGRFTITQISLCMLYNLFLLSLFLLLRNKEILIICFWFYFIFLSIVLTNFLGCKVFLFSNCR